MNDINILINKLKSNKIHFLSLSELADIRTGKLNANAKTENGEYPFFTCDAIPYKIDTYAFDTDAIIISGNGSRVGHINQYKGKFNAYQRTYVLDNFKKVIKPFLYHYLGAGLKEYISINSKKGSVPYITLPILNNFKVPVPPLEIQEKIVEILDKFTDCVTELTAELTAELTLRRKQYEWYRDLLFTNNSYDKIKIKNFAQIRRGGNFQKKDFLNNGMPCIHYGQIYTTYGVFTNNVVKTISKEAYDKSKKASKDEIIMAVTSENIDDVCKCTAWVGDEEIAVSGHTAILKHNQNAKYLSYYFSTNDFYKQKIKYVHGTKVIEVTPNALYDIEVPLPSLAEQQRIVDILDKFDAYCNDLTQGLPAEIEARQKQYEYYRDKLLTFKPLED